jgi:hypothetical protein
MTAAALSSHHVISRDDSMEPDITVTTRCPLCGSPGSIVVSRAGYLHWIAGGGIRQWLPSLDQNQRDQLLSGICEACWTRIFEDGEDGARRLVEFLAEGINRRVSRAKGAAR